MTDKNPDGRWESYFLARGSEFNHFWQEYLLDRERNILFIVGAGFDPRTPMAIERLCSFEGLGNRDIFLIDYNEGTESYSHNYSHLKYDYLNRIRKAVDLRGKVDTIKVDMWSNDSRPHRIGSRRVTQVFSYSLEELGNYSDIIIDISALPRSLFFSLTSKIIEMSDQAESSKLFFPNVHAVAVDSLIIDSIIQPEGIDEEVLPVTGFASPLDRQSDVKLPRVWFALLQEGVEIHLRRIYDMVKPNEIVPIVPWPSKNPRRGDDLLIEYRQYLYDGLRVEPRQTLYVPENNPFGVYRQIYRAALKFNETLKILGGCTIVISALSNKLLSLGALLAAHQLKQEGINVVIVELESAGYSIKPLTVSPDDMEIFSMWLTGSKYE